MQTTIEKIFQDVYDGIISIDQAIKALEDHQQSRQTVQTLGFEQCWQPIDIESSPLPKSVTILCIVQDRQIHKQLESAITAKIAAAKLAFITSVDDLASQITTVEQQLNTIDWVFWLDGISQPKCIENAAITTFHLLQGLAKLTIKPRCLLLAGTFLTDIERCHLESLLGFECSISAVIPNFRVNCLLVESEADSQIDSDASSPNWHSWLDKLINCAASDKDRSLLYSETKVHALEVQARKLAATQYEIPPGQTVLITGGFGGLGLIFAEHLAKNHGCHLILTGRSALTAKKQSQLDKLQSYGITALYLQADVVDEAGMKAGLTKAMTQLSDKTGKQQNTIFAVIHGAGNVQAKTILEKTEVEFHDVWSTKTQGTVTLDECLQPYHCQFVIYFSSTAAVLGDFGACDYAVANRFQMAYARYRQRKQPQVRTLVINWPLWRDGGMAFEDDKQADFYLQSTGLAALETDTGLALFDRLLNMSESQLLIMSGYPERINRSLKITKTNHSAPANHSASAKTKAKPSRSATNSDNILSQLCQIAAKILHLDATSLNVTANLTDYGFDSMSLAEFAQLLSQNFCQDVSPTLFFKQSSLDKLNQYFTSQIPIDQPSEQMITAPTLRSTTEEKPPQSIAVIGMSGCFAQSNNIAQFWQNLFNGRDCTTDLPYERWQIEPERHSEYQGAKGGFIDDIDKFDSLFFEITPKDASAMDPCQRIFLQQAWAAFEDAGYMGERIEGRACGVYVGVEEGEYGYLSQGWSLNSNQNATLAARIAYALDLKGPNLALTAACSSGLVALHQGCVSLKNQECDLALVGGINLMVSAIGYQGLDQAQMLSPSGRCRVFAQDADGMVPGEAVAAVVLKPLETAMRDNDRIYGCIVASGINYDGHSNGITAPSQISQAELYRKVHQQHQIAPQDIQYMLVHSTGSPLGDPIEFEALVDAWGNSNNPCILGSIKPLIGHTFAASGIVSLIAMLMALQHKTILASHCGDNLNRHIKANGSVFEFSTENQPWQPRDKPRMGAITTTGINGTNAHVVITQAPTVKSTTIQQQSSIFVLSAANSAALLRYANTMLHFLEQDVKASIADICHTLQVGRKPMQHRLAIVCSTKHKLKAALSRFITKGQIDNDEIFHGNQVKTTSSCSGIELKSVAEQFCQGALVDWSSLQGTSGHIISLPTYPFEKRSHWFAPLQANDMIKANDNMKWQSSNTVQDDIVASDKVIELYNLITEDSCEDAQQGYITFFPLNEKLPGFSITRVASNPDLYPQDVALIRQQQTQMRQVLFCSVNFSTINSLFDFGCGYGTDVIDIARLYPHMRTNGFTITPKQAEVGNNKIARFGLSDRVRIFNEDSAVTAFPERYDLVVGTEVSCHIEDKHGLFVNIVNALKPGGSVLLMDFTANLRGAIEDAKVSIFISTREQWVDILAAHRLTINELIDVSPQIANAQYDPEFEQNTKNMPQVVKDSWRNWTNFAVSMEKGWVSYVLLKICYQPQLSVAECAANNREKMANPVPYPQALEKMLETGYMPYPQPERLKQLDGQLIPNAQKESQSLVRSTAIDADDVQTQLMIIFEQVMQLHQSDIEQAETFNAMGINSLNAIELMESINRHFDLNLPTSLIFSHKDMTSLAKFIVPNIRVEQQSQAPITPEQQTTKAAENVTAHTSNDIAVIGLSVACAGASDQRQFWQLIAQGKSTISEIDAPLWCEFFDQHGAPDQPRYYGGMADLDGFDAVFFKISPVEAKQMDVSQKQLIQHCYNALEDAAIAPSSLARQAVGTYIGIGAVMTEPPSELSRFSMLGFDTSIAASRIAHFLDFAGPAVAVNTACSSSLVALDMACRALRCGEINLAVSGGITLWNNPSIFVSMHNAGMLSNDGQCKTFGNDADGIVVGDGVGIVVLKRQLDAEQQGDPVYGIIRACGTNQDGQTSGITVPNMLAQSDLQSTLYRQADINVEDIQYIESHGTGTSLGDPIEIDGLTHSFSQFSDKKQYCAIGSLKANIGHTAAAAGILGLIKVLLCFKHQKYVPQANFTSGNSQINKRIAFEQSPFVIDTKLRDWPLNSKGSRLAAVSSFGYSGTNAHLVVEQSAQPPSPTGITIEPVIVPLSAKTSEQLKQLVANLLAWLDLADVRYLSLADLAYTLQCGRDMMKVRVGFVVADLEQLRDGLNQYLKQGIISSPSNHSRQSELLQQWLNGQNLLWQQVYAQSNTAKRIHLPTYCFAKTCHGVFNSGLSGLKATLPPSKLMPLGKQLASQMYQPVWHDTTIDHQTQASSQFVEHHVLLCDLTNIALATSIHDKFLVQRIFTKSDQPERAYCETALAVFDYLQKLVRSKPQQPLLIQLVTCYEHCNLLQGLSGMLKTVQQENPVINTQFITLDTGFCGDVRQLLCDNSYVPEQQQVRYQGDLRQVQCWQRLQPNLQVDKESLYSAAGAYLLTGGAGGLGLVICRQIAQQNPKARLILVGRSPLNSAQLEKLKAVEQYGASIEYHQLDITERTGVNGLIQHCAQLNLKGVFHCAGVTEDDFILNKSAQQFSKVLEPKVKGTVNLHQACVDADIALNFFVLFSSVASCFGNVGQADYACANGFMDAYAHSNPGIISLNWPLWEHGGMQVDEQTLKILADSHKVSALSDDQGLQFLHLAMKCGLNQVMIYKGIDSFSVQAPTLERQVQNPDQISVDETKLQAQILVQLQTMLAKITGLTVEQIDPFERFEQFGMDSVMITELNQMLAKKLGDGLSKTLFYEYADLNQLSHFFANQSPCGWQKTVNQTQVLESEPKHPDQNSNSIAIIGLSGRYGSAATLDEFWQGLRAGIDMVTTIPADRWPLEGFYQPEVLDAINQGKSYSKWGAFMPSFAEFDPLFFNISPVEAMMMDPQERLLLELCWEAVEDSGYTRELLAQNYQKNVAVFTAITKTGFNLYTQDKQNSEHAGRLHTSFASMANRVSFVMDFTGPSMPVDTMCSSSLTAIHMACEHIRRADIPLALVGAVNLYLHPSNYTQLCAGKMLSQDGRCKSFGNQGNGFVPGEGVGAVMLKALSSAQNDGDNIHGVILGSSINHGGKSNGYTIPNPTAQAQVIRQAMDSASVQAVDISYIEAHGTGTELGDPVEVSGLHQAFGQSTRSKRHCMLGSVKSNIGHLEAAAGMVGLTKILLQMRHGEIVPSLHSRSLNPNIDFNQTPFIVPQHLMPWPSDNTPYIAGISSFGAGGANAHLIIKQYQHISLPPSPQGEYAVLLSARNEADLASMISRLLVFLQDNENVRLGDIAYTLQVGREAMAQRLVLKVETTDQLKRLLQALDHNINYQEGQKIYRNEVTQARLNCAKRAPNTCLNNLQSAINTYLQGDIVDWQQFPQNHGAKRITLPTYPFARQRFWFIEPTLDQAQSQWLFTEQRWHAKDFIVNHFDWQQSLEKHKGQQLLLVCESENDLKAMSALLQQLQQAIGQTQLLNIMTISESDKGISQLPEIPDVVLFMLSEQPYKDPLTPQFERLQPMLELAASLMDQAFGHNIELFLLYHGQSDCPQLECESIFGFAASSMLENPCHRWHLVGYYDRDDNLSPSQLLLQEWLGAESVQQLTQVRYQGLKRSVKIDVVSDMSNRAVDIATDIFRHQGCYLIAGGSGYLGLELAERLATEYKATMVLLARNGFEHCQDKLQQLRDLGTKIYCYQADIIDKEQLAQVLAEVQQSVGTINGIFNLTRQHQDQTLATKSWSSFEQVIASKVQGSLHLDSLTKDLSLDFFVLFASMGAYGVRGSCDYAYANAFQTVFAQYREQLTKQGKRSGRCFAPCWGAWEKDLLFPETRTQQQAAGFALINMNKGMAALQQGIFSQHSTLCMVLVNDINKVKTGFGLNGAQPQKPQLGYSSEQPTAVNGQKSLTDLVLQTVKTILQLDEVPVEQSFVKLGMDSISAMHCAVSLERQLNRPIKAGLFMEYATVAALTKYLCQNAEKQSSFGYNDSIEVVDEYNRDGHPEPAPLEDIAIIGLSGYFPDCMSVDEFWQSLERQQCVIRTIPQSRFDWQQMYDPQGLSENKSCSKWGGFIPDIKGFDAAFFNIKPTAAKYLDPRQRLLLMSAYHSLEDAGIDIDNLKGSQTGVYIAAEDNEYRNYLLAMGATNSIPGGLGETDSLLANQISYYFDFNGPSEFINAQCCGGATAIHRAVCALRGGEINRALVGAANLMLTPEPFIRLSFNGMLSSHDQVRSFAPNADGLIRSEAVATLMLRPSVAAQADGDHIYAVIKNTAVNYNGAGGTSIAAPDSEVHARLIFQCYQAAAINPADVEYIEVQGMGNPVADLAEWQACNKALTELAQQSNQTLPPGACFIGTLKPKAGHMHAASAIAAVFKLIHGFAHNKRYKIDGLTTIDEQFKDTQQPCRLITEDQAWLPKHGQRLAGIHSYGASGSNAHLLLADHPKHGVSEDKTLTDDEFAMVFSAQEIDGLIRLVEQMLTFIDNHPNLELRNVAYTLQTGRKAMAARLAFVVSDITSWVKMLKQYLQRAKTGLWTKRKGKLSQLAKRWCDGQQVNWQSLYQDIPANKVRLPGYVFATKEYWVDDQHQANNHSEQINIKVDTLPTNHEIQAQITNLIAETLDVAPDRLGENPLLVDLGLDSLILMQLSQKLRARFDPSMHPAKLRGCKTLQQLLDSVQTTAKPQPQLVEHFPELIKLNQAILGQPIFWFHSGLGGVEVYQVIAKHSERPFYGIQAKGWLTDGVFLNGMQAIVSYYIHIILSVQKQGPYSLGGYSLGGTIAYEVTRQLQCLGHEVDNLVMIDSSDMTNLKDVTKSKKREMLITVNMALQSTVMDKPERIPQTLIHRDELDLKLDDDQFLEKLLMLAKQRGLRKTDALMRTMVRQMDEVTQGYEIEDFEVLPLPNAEQVKAYYFRNQGGRMMGELAPFYTLTASEDSLDHCVYWQQWEKNLPYFNCIDVEVSNHLMFLSEAKAYGPILTLCQELYASPSTAKVKTPADITQPTIEQQPSGPIGNLL